MKANNAVRNGTYFRNSGPIMSRAMLLRTKPWKDSPRNWPLPGTSCGLRTASRNSTYMITAEKTSISTGFVSHSTPAIGGRLKSSTPGGVETRCRSCRCGGQDGHPVLLPVPSTGPGPVGKIEITIYRT